MMWKNIKVSNFDLIVDDGCHQFEATLNFLMSLLTNYLKMDFILLKTFMKEIKKYINYFKKKPCNFYFINLNNEFDYKDNNLLLVTNFDKN